MCIYLFKCTYYPQEMNFVLYHLSNTLTEKNQYFRIKDRKRHRSADRIILILNTFNSNFTSCLLAFQYLNVFGFLPIPFFARLKQNMSMPKVHQIVSSQIWKTTYVNLILVRLQRVHVKQFRYTCISKMLSLQIFDFLLLYIFKYNSFLLIMKKKHQTFNP